MDPSEEAVGTSAVESDAQAEDRKLAAAILRKERKATAEFVAKYADPIYRYVRSRLIPRMDLVDDLVQEVFLAAWESLPSYRGDSPLVSWLQGIAHHKVKNQYRACLRAPLPLEEAEQETPKVVMEVDIDELLDRGRLQQKTRRALATVVPANPDHIDRLGVVASLSASFRSRAALPLEILALRHQLGVLQRSVKRSNLTPADRLLWAWLRRVWQDWQSGVFIRKASTVLGWHQGLSPFLDMEDSTWQAGAAGGSKGNS